MFRCSMNSVVSSVMLEDEHLPVLLQQDGADEFHGSASCFYSDQSSFLWGENMTKDKSDVACDGRTLKGSKQFEFPESSASSSSRPDGMNEHFSYYTSETDKLIRQLELHNAGNESFGSQRLSSWSPICGHISILPTVETDNDRLAGGISAAAGDASSEKPTVPEKLSYSDVLSKSPVPQQAKRDAKSSKSERSSKPRTTTSSRDAFAAHEPNVAGGVPNGKAPRHAARVKTEKGAASGGDAGCCDKSDNPTCNNRTHRTGFEVPRVDAAKDSGSDSSEREVPKVTLNNNVHNPQQKASSQKRPLNFNNNLSSSWKDVKFPAQFKPKVKNTKYVDADDTPLAQRRNVSESESAKKQVHRKMMGGHSKDLYRRSSSRKKSKSSENIDVIWSIVAVHLQQCVSVMTTFIHWLLDLILDVSQMSAKLFWQILQMTWVVSVRYSSVLRDKMKHCSSKLMTYLRLKCNKSQPTSTTKKSSESSSESNIALPTTREAAMKRLLSCKGKDPYSILGVGPLASDDDIKKYYRRQAFLVHPDKNPTPGTEEAFKILAQAFELIGEPERRQVYDSKMTEAHQLETAWDEFSELITKLREKVEEAANTIKCTKCGDRHQRVKVERPCYSARYCAACKTFHAARDGDIWAESTYLGFLWHYYACMENTIYDVTQWAGCQMKNLQHLKANHHNVQYRIVSSKQSPSSENIPRSPDLEDLLSAFQGKKMPPNATAANGNGNNPSSASKADSAKKRKNKKKR